MIAFRSSSIRRRSTFIGNTRPCLFFVVPGSSRISPASKSIRVHSIVRTSDATRHEVIHANSTTCARSRGSSGRGRRERLSILRLTEQVDPAIHNKVRGLVSKAIKKTKFARDWRDRRIAHTDLRLALKKGAKPLAPASRKRMGEAIAAIVAVLAAVEGHYCKTTTAYEHASRLGDAETLLHVLRDGVDARREEQRRLQAGGFPSGGFKPKPPI